MKDKFYSLIIIYNTLIKRKYCVIFLVVPYDTCSNIDPWPSVWEPLSNTRTTLTGLTVFVKLQIISYIEKKQKQKRNKINDYSLLFQEVPGDRIL